MRATEITAFVVAATVVAACHPRQPESRRESSPAVAHDGGDADPGSAAVKSPTPPPSEVVEVEAPPPPPPAPPYDLAADLEARKRIARSELGNKVRLTVVEDVFLVVGAPPTTRREYDRALWMIRASTAAYFNKRFEKRPARAISIYLFYTKGTYNKYCNKSYGGCGTPYGVYFRDDRRIVMNARPGLGTLTHELVHPIVATDFPRAPDWIDEGIASLFERPALGKKGEIHGKKNWRHPRVLSALRSKKEREIATLDRLFAMDDGEFRGANEDLGYAMARYFCQWLDHKGMLWSFYQRWRDDFDDDPTGEKAFRAVVGKTPAQATAEWARWVKRL
jgi:hypothetical protein